MKDLVIETDRITMKSTAGRVNAKDIVNAIDDRETLEFLSSVPFEYTEDNANDFLAFLRNVEDSKETIQLGMFHKEYGTFIGMVTLENIDYDNHSCELGYWISKRYTGRGMAYEAASKVVQFAFSSLKMRVIKAYVIKEHKKSISLLERLGFQQKQLLLNNEENKGVMVDRYLYTLKNIEVV